MSTVLSTMANALIDFILSLLRDPDAAAAFDGQPEATLADAGLSGVSYDDVCSVMPLIYDNPQVVQRASDTSPTSVTPAVHPTAQPMSQTPPDVIRELRDVINNNSYINNNSTLVDQSVNQNIWADGDVMQLFDNETVVASGEGSTAAGNDVVHDSSQNSGTTIIAGRDAAVDNDTDVTATVDSYNQTTDNSTNTGTAPAAATPADVVTAAAAAPAAEPVAAPEPAAAPGAGAARRHAERVRPLRRSGGGHGRRARGVRRAADRR